jgi:hypothetical protein
MKKLTSGIFNFLCGNILKVDIFNSYFPRGNIFGGKPLKVTISSNVKFSNQKKFSLGIIIFGGNI